MLHQCTHQRTCTQTCSETKMDAHVLLTNIQLVMCDQPPLATPSHPQPPLQKVNESLREKEGKRLKNDPEWLCSLVWRKDEREYFEPKSPFMEIRYFIKN